MVLISQTIINGKTLNNLEKSSEILYARIKTDCDPRNRGELFK